MLVDSNAVVDFEIVIGLVAPIGTNVDNLVTLLESQLDTVHYATTCVRLSSFLDEAPVGHDLPATPSDPEYYEERMTAGDQLREMLGTGDALAAYAISKIRSLRYAEKHSNDQNVRRAWILRTIKHPEEVRLLRATYGRRFILISATETEHARRTNIVSGLKDANPADTQLDSKVALLVARDEQDARSPYGQHVRDAYAMGDFFVDLDSHMNPRVEIERIIGLLFGRPFITPRPDEQSMFLAFAASLRSADPGRQVGAVITRPNGDVLSIGANEVPRPSGGEYWEGDPEDHRDFRVGIDFNRREVRRALQELLDTLAREGHLSDTLTGLSGPALLARILDQSSKSIEETRVRNLIEFGRIVHAEMSALMQASRVGSSTEGATIYTTAFPCHMCMRLIIASGVRRVVYVDPYPKSLAGEMYATEIRLDDRQSDYRVSVEPYFGASWRVYQELFSSVNRQRDPITAKFLPWAARDSRMRLAEPDPLVGADALEVGVPPVLEGRLARARVDAASVGGERDDGGSQASTEEER